MQVVGEPGLEKFWTRHTGARDWLQNWLAIVRGARWQRIQDVWETYPTADGGVKVKSGGKVTVFDVGGNNYRLIVTIAYKAQAVTVLEVMTHAEYSKHLWKARY